MFFSQDWRERIKAENPDAGFGQYRSLLVLSVSWLHLADVSSLRTGEVGKLLGAKWKELDDSEKRVRSFPSSVRSSRDASLFHLYLLNEKAD